ncbi:MAG: hydantoinase/oxoprolinase family protein [Halanaeroarchaeum sp.]
MIVGIDTGGTNVDAVLIDEDGVVNKAKVTNAETRESIESVLTSLLAEHDATRVDRVVVATTLVVNAAVQDRLPSCSNVVIPGPGLAPERAFYGEENVVLDGGVDPRGRVFESVTETVAPENPVTAITAKFSSRNPAPEREVAERLDDETIALGNESGAGFSFPERAATTVANARAKPLFVEYEADIEAAVNAVAIEAPIYYLKGDGAMLSSSAMSETPAHTLRGGSAASALGLVALSGVEEAVTVDVGGTTTDVARIEDGFPAIERGAGEGDVETAYEAVVAESLPIGGDTKIEPTDGGPACTDERVGNAVAFGGDAPTVTDALHVTGAFTEGDVAAATAAIEALDDGPATSTAAEILDAYAQRVREALDEVASESSGTLVAGGVLAPYLGERLIDGLDITELVVPEHADVAGAVGCGVARVSVETAVHVDSARGVMTVTAVGPESVESVETGRQYTREAARSIAMDRARDAAVTAGGEGEDPVEIRSMDRFSVVETGKVVGQIFDATARVEPGIRYRSDGGFP